MKIVLTALLLLLGYGLMAQTKAEAAIRQMLGKQEAAWNNGDLDKFMIGYWESDSLLFIGKNGPTYGYRKTLANYKKGYPDTAHMGKFTSTIISLKKITRNNYFVLGKWFLQRSVGNAGGHYTLFIKKIKGKWLIVADHSS